MYTTAHCSNALKKFFEYSSLSKFLACSTAALLICSRLLSLLYRASIEFAKDCGKELSTDSISAHS